MERLEYDGFQNISKVSLASINKSHHSLAGQAILWSFGIADDISSIVGAHHGKPIDNRDLCKSQIESYKTNYFQVEEKDEPIYKKWKESQNSILNWALKLSGFESIKSLPKINQGGQVILSGLLTMADWIASNETYFPLINIELTKVEERPSREEKAISLWYKNTIWQPNDYFEVEEMYENRFGFSSPNPVQKALWEIVDESKNPGIIILEAPMGNGKTEASLVASEQLAVKLGKSGVFFGLPTQATSNGIFPRISDWLDKIAKEEEENLQLRLVHGKASLNKDFAELKARSESSNIEMDLEDGTVLVNQWFSGRKTTNLDEFVVGTVDQFLLTALKQKHLSLRHLGFSKKVVIIDEVHAYDSYMNQYLLMAIRWMAYYKVPIVILSATLPEDRRKALIKHYMLGLGAEERDLDNAIEEMETSYPLITYNDDLKIKQFFDFEKEEDSLVEVEKIFEEDLYNLVDDLFSQQGVIGIMVNTVRKAQEISKNLLNKYGQENVELLHSSFIATDRIKKEETLIGEIGKNGKRPDRKIIVGTQVIEQSLDIDFDILISELAPMDLLIQRIGRLHRHDRQRPDSKKKPRLFVLGASEKLEFDSGSSYIYGDYLLTRTQYFLPEQILIPSDISKLVDLVYGNEEIDLPDCLNELYQEFKNYHYRKISQKESKAKTFRLSKPVIKATRKNPHSIIGWLNDSSYNESEERAYAQVRDTEETIEIIALKKIGQGYGFFGQEEDISDQIENPEILMKMANSTIKLPSLLSKNYNIETTIRELETYNMKHLSSWQDQAWLKGSLGLIFDENSEAIINNLRLKYCIDLGLSYEGV